MKNLLIIISIFILSLSVYARDWTVILYTSPDKSEGNCMTEYLKGDLSEMQKVDDNFVKFIVESDKWYDLKWKDTGKTDINGQKIYERADNSVGSWGEHPTIFDISFGKMTMYKVTDEESGHRDNIVKLITWAANKYPANYYLLAFDGHGNGSMGNFGDVKVAELNSTIEKLKIYLKNKLNISIFNKLKVISFASCLMNTVAVNYEVKDGPDYVTGSEHPSLDTHYDKLGKHLPGNSPKNAAFEAVNQLDSPTASAISLKILRSNADKSLYSSLTLFVEKIIDADKDDQIKYINALHHVLEKVQRFDTDWFELVDLHHFFSLVAKEDGFSDSIKDIAKRIIEISKANGEFIVKNSVKSEFFDSSDKKYLDSMKNANGISIYFPMYKTKNVNGIEGEEDPYNFNEFKKLQFCKDTKYSWDKLIALYYDIMKNGKAKIEDKTGDSGDALKENASTFWNSIFN